MSRTTNDIRRAFLDFFATRGHLEYPSAPLTPQEDPTLLFINAGMAPLKPFFVGERQPPQARLVTAQKCVRAGGKHNDLDNVGYTARHHTFFEMLGNFSFGDYFKEQAVDFAWQFLTQELGLAKDKLLVTVYHTDDEAAALWRKIAGLGDDRIIRISTDDNFWSMGDTGPCGPCSEIFYDHGAHVPGGPPGSPDEDGDRFVEIWNLVFMQFDRQADGTQVNLPAPCIDTGSGLERLSAAVQGVTSNYDTDLFQSLVNRSTVVTGNRNDADAASHRVVADHLRTCGFLISEGVLPSNDGRGYVLRRILRRGLRHFRLLVDNAGREGRADARFAELVPTLVAAMGEHYQELTASQSKIEHALNSEEDQFRTTLERGMRILEREVADLRPGAAFSGATAFRLYDTYGFPLDLTQDVLRGRGLEVDTDAFEAEMDQQRDRARGAWSGSGDTKSAAIWNSLAEELGETEFLGYSTLTSEQPVAAIVVGGERVTEISAGTEAALIFGASPFYGESGGQAGDSGQVEGNGAAFAVTDTQKPQGGLLVHEGRLERGTLKVGDRLSQHVNAELRARAAANHSATHLLNAALRTVLGDHVMQKGSYVGADRLRFDFSHGQAVSLEEQDRIEALVNEEVIANVPTHTALMALDDALNSGAVAMFGEKYDAEVRVLSMGRQTDGQHFSVELCGGTHVERTGDIGLFKIVSESSVGAGVRRIEAVTRQSAVQQVKADETLLRELVGLTRSSREQLLDDVQRLIAERKRLTAEVKAQKEGDAVARLADQQPETVGAWRLLGATAPGFQGRELKDLVRKLLDDDRADVVCLISPTERNVGAVVGLSKAASAQQPAKALLGTVLEAMGGGSGGGPPTLAQGATKTPPADDAAELGLAALRTALTG
ncbi:MAG: alanine--tRNA ligase [Pseudomonadota bacterium]